MNGNDLRKGGYCSGGGSGGGECKGIMLFYDDDEINEGGEIQKEKVCQTMVKKKQSLGKGGGKEIKMHWKECREEGVVLIGREIE